MFLWLGRKHYAPRGRTGFDGDSVLLRFNRDENWLILGHMIRKQHEAVAGLCGSESPQAHDLVPYDGPGLIAFARLKLRQTLNRDNTDILDKVDLPVDALCFVRHVA